MTTAINTCRIWGENYKAIGHSIPDPSKIDFSECSRVGGGYVILGGVGRHLHGLDDGAKARLTTWLVDQRALGDIHPEITEAVIDYVKARRPLPVHERAERLLKFIALNSMSIGQYIDLFPFSVDGSVPRNAFGEAIYPPFPTNPTFLQAMAWSESTTTEEVEFLLDYLSQRNWTQKQLPRSSHVQVTLDGYARIQDLETAIDSAQAFVAMWFDDSLKEPYDEGIEPAIREAGYKAMRIDRKPDVDKIDDEIIAEIRKSRFLVADFTHGDKGARGGVYFEAGFAFGLGKPVIYTCRADMVNDLHFDTRQYAHIVWKTPEELREGLKNRILARIGEGPGLRPLL